MLADHVTRFTKLVEYLFEILSVHKREPAGTDLHVQCKTEFYDVRNECLAWLKSFVERAKSQKQDLEHCRYAITSLELCRSLKELEPCKPDLTKAIAEVRAWVESVEPSDDENAPWDESVGEDGADEEDVRRRRRGLELWNDGKTWREVAETLYPEQEHDRKSIEATTSEIDRHAKAHNLYKRRGKTGAKKKNSDESDV